VHPHTGEAGALGAAFETLRVVKRKGRSTFIGLEAAIGLEYEARNDESTVCHFCPNHCKRTFIDTRSAPSGATSRYISGFSCEKGTVESQAEMLKALVAERKKAEGVIRTSWTTRPSAAFRSFYKPKPMPANRAPCRRTSW
jgi:hypothetical protein